MAQRGQERVNGGYWREVWLREPASPRCVASGVLECPRAGRAGGEATLGGVKGWVRSGAAPAAGIPHPRHIRDAQGQERGRPRAPTKTLWPHWRGIGPISHSSPNLRSSGASSQAVERGARPESPGRTFSTVPSIAPPGQGRVNGRSWLGGPLLRRTGRSAFPTSYPDHRATSARLALGEARARQ